MFSLVKIRARYLSRHLCAVYCTNLFIPTLIIIIILIIGKERSRNYYDQKFPGKTVDTNVDLFKQNLTIFEKKDIVFITEDIKDCDIITKIIGKSINCKIIGDLTIDKNLPNIKIINKDDKYDIQLQLEKDYSLFYSGILSEDYVNLFISPVSKDIEKISYLSTFEDYYDRYYPTFLSFQSLFTKFLILKKGQNFENKELLMNIGINAYPPNIRNYYYSLSLIGTTVYITIAICFQFSTITYFFNMRMIDEKDKKLTILLERQGVSKKSYFFSWILSYLILAIIPLITFLLFYIFYIPFHISLFIINLLLFICSLFSLAYFFYVCISTSKTASIIIKFVNFTSAVLGAPIAFPQCPKITKVILAFIPQVNIYLCSNSIDKLQKFNDLSWEKLWLKANKLSYMESIIMYLVDILLYSLLSIFIESYKNSGLDFFQFIKSFFTKVSRTINYEQNEIEKIIEFERHFQELSPINKQKKSQNDCLSLVNISKNFGPFKAVDNFNVDLFGNEIFCLLGHNGAGKSTLIKMISGIYEPSNGDIFYNGRSIVTDKDFLFENIGICQQEDIFFDYLTVSEHLEYMCQIKGGNNNINEVKELITKIGLEEKSNSICKTLSGGQKRKLCTALALIGNSNIILLDEPTSGMDHTSKKCLLDFLKNYQKNKIILITTHSLDEAEYLGDRIGIMCDGNFICCGTSSYLKSKYPCGININLLINSEKFNEENKNIIFEKIQTYETKAEIKIASKSMLSINIQSNNEHISEIFNFIEESKEELGIEDYTVASTSLEDVFLKINNKSNSNDMKYISQQSNYKEIILPENIVEMTGFFPQLISQIGRNLLPIKRNKMMILLEYFSGLGIIYLFVFLFSELIYGITYSKLDLIKILEENKNYIYEDDSVEGFLKNSYVYDSSSFITLKKLSNPSLKLSDLINNSYEESLANIALGSISIKKKNQIWEANLSQINIGYLFANTMFVVSSFLKNEYNIDAMILSKMELKKEMKVSEENRIYQDTLSVLIIICIGSVLGFIIYLGGLINEKVKERITNIKHLLYLSGSNSFSYWISFLIIDYLKLFIFTILLIIPICYVSPTVGYYFFLNMIIICLSSLIFIYFISFFGSNADSGVKFLLVFALGLFIFLLGLAIFIVFIFREGKPIMGYVIESLSQAYNFTVFDLTPITSMLLSFGRFLYDISRSEKYYNHKKLSNDYLITSYIIQFINFVFYTILLILMENGYMREYMNYLKLKICIFEKNFNFSEEQMSDEFLQNNNISNPLIINQMNPNEQSQYQNKDINIPIYGNNIDSLKIPVSNNNNENNNLIISNTINSNINQPLLEGINNNSVNNINANNNHSDKNDLTLSETNRISNVRQDLSFINEEKNKLNTRKDLTTRIEGLRKTFWFCCKKNVRAINNLYLGLEANEKFGLLGFNGSGKTTTFKAITNEILYDKGKITLFQHDNKTEFELIRSRIGYCPQENPLFEFMKVREILQFYSNLKTSTMPYLMISQKLGLTKYLDTYCINLSGGNKRKLTFAIAIMNSPTLLLLDEPSTGVDPESRRYIWKSINELSNTGHKYNMILTTHSMEEAEILCDRVSWLKQGNFICIGHPEKLKIQYSLGYTLHVKFDDEIINQNRNNLVNNIVEAYRVISSLVMGFTNYSNYILNNPNFEPYIRTLIDIINKIKKNTKNILLVEIGKDFSFKLIVKAIPEKKQALFVEILNMKNNNNSISEMIISMESLENIMTSFR